MDNTTYAVCNSVEKSKYPLEQMLDGLALSKGVFIVAVFDCCRSKLPNSMRSDSVKIGSDDKKRGLNGS